jgi:uncharacterized membrane protein HdeD (DUF308 family)
MKQRKIKMPPIWMAMALSVAGIIGTRLVYASIAEPTSFLQTIIGIILLVVALITVGTPLAYSMYWRRELKERSRERIR